MATSPIYGWAEPDNTDLVKNGALAIRTLGNAIDTTMGTMVAKTIIDAKGDLIAGSAADTALRLAVGSNGETLVADSSTSTGLRYTAGTVQANPVLNSCMDIWQRGTSVAVANSSYTFYSPDRWQTYRGSTGGTISRQVTGDTTNLPNVQYCMRVQRDSGTTSTSFFQSINNFESINSIPYAGKTVTFSFYARAGANYSATSNALVGFLVTGTGTDQNANFGFTGAANTILVNATLTTTWQRFTGTATIPSATTQIGTGLSFTPTGTAGANDYYEVTGVQIDIGSVALPVRRNGATIQGELAACQRYYYRQGGDSAYQAMSAYSNAVSTTNIDPIIVPLPVTMRVEPTVLDTNAIMATDGVNVFTGTFTLATQDSRSLGQIKFVGSGLTAFRGYTISANNSTSAYVGLSAEL